ncbi:MAG: hypothetical protein AMS27_01995 [Bacteroides sp. SM23_62_1]|nr:MAG: hypothetical protein AMS27_01995 [Bacteroides sp. SM23_62_1]
MYSQSQDTDSLHVISGRLIDALSRDGIQFAHIINQTRSHAMISDTLGFFRILAGSYDFLLITAIGYYNLPVILNDSLVRLKELMVLKLIPRIYPISEVKVGQLGTYEQFKYRFLNTDLPEPEHQMHPSIIPDIEKGIDTLNIIGPLSVMSPISAIYYLLSKEGKSLRKLEEIKEEEQFMKQVEHKYNLEMLTRITGMQGEELYEFTTFCNFSREFLLDASEYEIIEAIFDKLKEYKKITGE